ncbi:unnamed protein product [Bursaphelenchus okinawaensis]|uniref:Globin domain-containing protein n=1 Tax=Bursaphelenchus okinawaensis TaxID=465554 RepID=A0A811L043_9BILA|nr:unnamed protein product [Bursaphelenchus okinawaensis]CAG9113793.1 unnamed protein product [Bursaphelenchus okinawaensis]
MVEVRERLLNSLKEHDVAVGPDNEQCGKDFYKYFFTNFPDLRSYFKGAEKYTADDVQKSERFEKQGKRLILACHFLASNADQPDIIKAYAREQVIRHRPFKMQHALWRAFFDVWLGYLASRGNVDEQTKQDWIQVGTVFADECVRYGKEVNIGHD